MNGKLVGSKLIGQDFRKPVIGKNGKPEMDKDGNPVLTADPRYFQSGPSTATDYNAAATRVHQPRAQQHRRARHVQGRTLAAYLALEQPVRPRPDRRAVPVDAVTSSASGVDPQISQANAAHPGAPHRGRPPPPAGARCSS